MLVENLSFNLYFQIYILFYEKPNDAGDSIKYLSL